MFGLTPTRADGTSVVFGLPDLDVILTDVASGHELIGPAPVAGPDVGSRKCFTIVVADVDAACAELAGKGVRLLGGPAARPWGSRAAWFADPGGHVYEIANGRLGY